MGITTHPNSASCPDRNCFHSTWNKDFESDSDIDFLEKGMFPGAI